MTTLDFFVICKSPPDMQVVMIPGKFVRIFHNAKRHGIIAEKGKFVHFTCSSPPVSPVLLR